MSSSTVLPRDWTVGYCTNIHAGTDLDSIRSNLTQYASEVRVSLGRERLDVGLWIPATAARELAKDTASFKSFMSEHDFRAYTINGFPYDNFHQEVVKHSVYRPTWCEDERRDYTLSLAKILAGLLDDDCQVGSISTLPIGWLGDQGTDSHVMEAAGKNFRAMADSLKSLHAETGKRIVLAIEPEPGCVIDTTEDLVDFFQAELTESHHREYITVCHDVCHSSVMMESQSMVLQRLAEENIELGKLQISSAIAIDWESMATGRRHEAVEQLRQFAEDRYLHQTGRNNSDREFVLSEDLPKLLDQIAKEGDPVWGDTRWVVHFHVPIFLERIGHLSTTQDDIAICLKGLADPERQSPEFTGHLEIETYAWTVLPESMRKQGLADEIANEFKWLRRCIIDVM